MPTIAGISLAIIVTTLAIAFGWRFFSRRWELPCPAAFIWMLENRIMENVAGAEVIIERARIAPGMRVLDAGCGPGRLTIPIARHVGPSGQVVAVDVQSAMLDKLAERIWAAGLTNVLPRPIALGEGELEEGGFDRAVMVTVLGEIPHQEAALREIYEALRPGGLLSITEVLPDPHYQSQRMVRALAAVIGFRIDLAASSFRWYTLNLIRPQQLEPPD